MNFKNLRMWVTAVLVAVLFVVTAGCGDPAPKAGGKAGTPKTNEYIGDANDRQPRAIGQTDGGAVLIVPKGDETIGTLYDDDCLGKAGDYTFAGDYSVLFRDKQGNRKELTQMDDLFMVHSSEDPIELGQIHFEGFDAVYFTPEPNGCQRIKLYMFSIDDQGDAHQWSFENPEEPSGELTRSALVIPGKEPHADNGRLVLPMKLEIGAKEGRSYDVSFKPDRDASQMKFESKKLTK